MAEHRRRRAPHHASPLPPPFGRFHALLPTGSRVIDGKSFGQVFPGLRFLCALIAPQGMQQRNRSGGLSTGIELVPAPAAANAGS